MKKKVKVKVDDSEVKKIAKDVKRLRKSLNKAKTLINELALSDLDITFRT